MVTLALPDGYHLSLSVSQALWADLLGEALPIQVGTGGFDLVDQGRKLLHTAETGVKGLITGAVDKLDDAPVIGSQPVRKVRGSLRKLARRGRDAASRGFREQVKIQGDWRARVSRDGSEFSYHEGGVTLDARAIFEVEGKAILFQDRFQIPFALAKDLKATASLNDVGFHRERKQLEGKVGDVSLSLGESLPLRLLKLVADRLIDRQISKMKPLKLIPASSLENMLSPGSGPLKFSAGIEDLNVGINENDLTLSVRFAFEGAA
jgi:hypothetical protein